MYRLPHVPKRRGADDKVRTTTKERLLNKVGIVATLQAWPGNEADAEQFLRSAGLLVEAKTGPTTWFAFKVAPATFGILDTFKDEDGRSAHVNGEVANGLFARAEELFVTHPDIKPLDILAEKL